MSPTTSDVAGAVWRRNPGSRGAFARQVLMGAGLLFAYFPAFGQSSIAGHYVERAGPEELTAKVARIDGLTHSVHVGVRAPGCVGEVIATGALNGSTLIAAPAKGDGDECVLILRFSRNALTIDESRCTYWHGARCGFSGSLTRITAAGSESLGATDPPKAPPSGPPSRPPSLGPSDERMKSCIQGVMDGAPTAPATAVVFCQCLLAELDRTIRPIDLQNASRGDTRALDAKMQAVQLTCANRIFSARP